MNREEIVKVNQLRKQLFECQQLENKLTFKHHKINLRPIIEKLDEDTFNYVMNNKAKS